MREEVALKTKELEERNREVEVRDKTSFDLEVSKHRVNEGQILSLSQLECWTVHHEPSHSSDVACCALQRRYPYCCSAG